MGVDGFRKILMEFPQALDHVKPGILFPLLEDGAALKYRDPTRIHLKHCTVWAYTQSI